MEINAFLQGMAKEQKLVDEARAKGEKVFTNFYNKPLTVLSPEEKNVIRERQEILIEKLNLRRGK